MGNSACPAKLLGHVLVVHQAVEPTIGLSLQYEYGLIIEFQFDIVTITASGRAQCETAMLG